MYLLRNIDRLWNITRTKIYSMTLRTYIILLLIALPIFSLGQIKDGIYSFKKINYYDTNTLINPTHTYNEFTDFVVLGNSIMLAMRTLGKVNYNVRFLKTDKSEFFDNYTSYIYSFTNTKGHKGKITFIFDGRYLDSVFIERNGIKGGNSFQKLYDYTLY